MWALLMYHGRMGSGPHGYPHRGDIGFSHICICISTSCACAMRVLPRHLSIDIPFVYWWQDNREPPQSSVPSAHAPNNALWKSICCLWKDKAIVFMLRGVRGLSRAYPNARVVRLYSKKIFLCCSGTCCRVVLALGIPSLGWLPVIDIYGQLNK